MEVNEMSSSESYESYEPNDFDRSSAVATAKRIATEAADVPPSQLTRFLEIAIEGGILSELVMRGYPRTPEDAAKGFVQLSNGNLLTVGGPPSAPNATVRVVPPKPERRPGSQVAPGQKPIYRDGATASTHSRVPVEQATAGKLYRVRDRVDAHGAATVWGENLSYVDAMRVKDSVVGGRKSKTARIEEMPVEGENPAYVVAPTLKLPVVAIPAAGAKKPTPRELWYEAGGNSAEYAGLMKKHGYMTDTGFLTPAAMKASQPAPDSQLEQLRKKAVATSAEAAAAAQLRHQNVAAAMADPPHPPPSPLSDELVDLPDGPAELPPEEEMLTEGEVHDVVGSVGGASDEDKSHAKKLADVTFAELQSKARVKYEEACMRQHDQGPWPSWMILGEFEHAAWRFHVGQGGSEPELTKEPRKVTVTMGSNG